MWRGVGAAVVLVALAGCSGESTEVTQPTTGAQRSDSAVPTETALAAGEAFRMVPAGYDDCDDTVLTSGWPTTMPYNSEVSAQCIVDAADAGAPAQYAFWGRDGVGGIVGTIIRVNATNDITFVDFTIDADGITDSFSTSCSELATNPFEPPVCGSQ